MFVYFSFAFYLAFCETRNEMLLNLQATVFFNVAEHSLIPLFHLPFPLKPSILRQNGNKQANNTNFNFLIIKLTYVPLPWRHD